MSGRIWTKKDLEYLKANYRNMPVQKIARKLRRSEKSVYLAAKVHGLSVPQKLKNEIRIKIRLLHAQDKTDVEIADALGIDRRTANAWRNSCKLPVNANAVVRAKQKGVRRQAEVLGIEIGGQLRSQAFRKFAAENGWPDFLAVREVQILNVLAAKGIPMTKLELALAIGTRTDIVGCNGSLRLLAGRVPGDSYTAHLVSLGFLSVLPKKSPGKGSGRSRDLYYLGPKAIEVLEERARQCQESDNNQS